MSLLPPNEFIGSEILYFYPLDPDHLERAVDWLKDRSNKDGVLETKRQFITILYLKRAIELCDALDLNKPHVFYERTARVKKKLEKRLIHVKSAGIDHQTKSDAVFGKPFSKILTHVMSIFQADFHLPNRSYVVKNFESKQGATRRIFYAIFPCCKESCIDEIMATADRYEKAAKLFAEIWKKVPPVENPVKVVPTDKLTPPSPVQTEEAKKQQIQALEDKKLELEQKLKTLKEKNEAQQPQQAQEGSQELTIQAAKEKRQQLEQKVKDLQGQSQPIATQKEETKKLEIQMLKDKQEELQKKLKAEQEKNRIQQLEKAQKEEAQKLEIQKLKEKKLELQQKLKATKENSILQQPAEVKKEEGQILEIQSLNEKRLQLEQQLKKIQERSETAL